MGDHLGDRSKSKRDTNRTNRIQSSGGKYESAPFWVPAKDIDRQPENELKTDSRISDAEYA